MDKIAGFDNTPSHPKFEDAQQLFDRWLDKDSYSRDQESMADDFGFRIMYSALGEVKGAAEFFEKIEKHAARKVGKDKSPEATPGFDVRLLSLLSTHPYMMIPRKEDNSNFTLLLLLCPPQIV